MNENSIILTKTQIAFLMFTFETGNPDHAVEQFVELLIYEGIDPFQFKVYLERMMIMERANVNH
jgi:hypothetical protein